MVYEKFVTTVSVNIWFHLSAISYVEIPKVWKTGNLVCKTVDKLCICFKSNISEKNELISFYKLNVVFSRIKRKSSQITRKISIKTGQFVIKNRSYTMPAAFTNNNKKYDYEKKTHCRNEITNCSADCRVSLSASNWWCLYYFIIKIYYTIGVVVSSLFLFHQPHRIELYSRLFIVLCFEYIWEYVFFSSSLNVIYDWFLRGVCSVVGNTLFHYCTVLPCLISNCSRVRAYCLYGSHFLFIFYSRYLSRSFTINDSSQNELPYA